MLLLLLVGKHNQCLTFLNHLLLCVSVVSGRIDGVRNSEASLESVVQVSVENVYRQIENHFSQDLEDSGAIQAHIYNWQNINADTVAKYADAVMVPKKCGVRRGDGLFLFVGKFRLGKAILQCAPRLETFSKLWQRAVDKKANPCTMNWSL